MKVRLILTLGAMLNIFVGHAQNFKDDFGKVLAGIEHSTSCHIVSMVTIYDSPKSKQKLMSFPAELRRNETAYRSKIGDVELVSNDDYLLYVDYEDKLIQIEHSPQVSRSDREFMKDFYVIDSVAAQKDSVQFVSKKENLTTYKVICEKGIFKSIVIVLNTSQNSISRIEYEYHQSYVESGSFVVIDYSLFNLNATIDKAVFRGDDIVARNGANFSLMDKYKEFELLNLYKQTY